MDIEYSNEIRGQVHAYRFDKWEKETMIHGYDRIIMNPPFENGEDVEQVTFCFNKHLKRRGRLVSIMSAGVKSNTRNKYIDFRNFVEENNGYFIDNGQAFKEAFNSTGTASVILILNKS